MVFKKLKIREKLTAVSLMVMLMSLTLSFSFLIIKPWDFVENAVSSAVSSALEDSGVFIKAQNHDFTSFGRIVLDKPEVFLSEEEQPVFTAEKVEIKNSIGSLARFFLFGTGGVNIDVQKGNVSIEDAKGKTEASGKRKNFSLYKRFSRNKVRINLSDFSLKYSTSKVGNISVDNLDFYLDLKEKFRIREMRANIPHVDFELTGGIKGTADNIKSTKDFNFIIKALDVSYQDADVKFQDVQGKAENGKETTVFLDLNTVPLTYSTKTVALRDTQAGVVFSKKGMKLSLKSSGTEYDAGKDTEIKLSDIDVSTLLKSGADSIDAAAVFSLEKKSREMFSGNLKLSADREKHIKAEIDNLLFMDEGFTVKAESTDGRIFDCSIESSRDKSFKTNAVADILKRTLKGQLSSDFSVFEISRRTKKIIDDKSSVTLDYSVSLDGGLTMRADVSGEVICLKTPVRYNAVAYLEGDDINFSGSGFSVGVYSFKPYGSFNFRKERPKFFFNIMQAGELVAQASVNTDVHKYELAVKNKDNSISSFMNIDTSSKEKKIDFTINSFGNIYDFTGSFEKDEVSIQGKGMDFRLKIDENIDIGILFKEFVMPDFTKTMDDNFVVDANIDLSIGIAEKTIDFVPADVKLKNRYVNCSFNLSFFDNIFRTDNFILEGGKSSWEGRAFFKLPEISSNFYKKATAGAYFKENGGDGEFSLSLLNRKDSSDFLLKADNIKLLRRFGIYDLSSNLMLNTDFRTISKIFGNVIVRDKNKSEIINLDLSFNGKKLYIVDSKFSYKTIKSDNLKMEFDLQSGKFAGSSDFVWDYRRSDRTSQFAFTLEYDGEVENGIKISEFKNFKDKSLLCNLKLKNVKLEDYKVQDTQMFFSMKGGELLFNSEAVKGFVNLGAKSFDLTLGGTLPFSGQFSGILSGDDVKIDCDIAKFPLELERIFIQRPIVEIYGGNLSGQLSLNGSKKNPEIFCNLFCPEMKIWEFWTENEYMTINNINIIGFEHSVKMLRTTASSVNLKNARTTLFETEGGLIFENMDVPYWYVDVYVPETESVNANIPLPLQNYNIDVERAHGFIEISGAGMKYVKVSGDVFGDDALFSSPMRAPYWLFHSVNSPSGKIAVADTDVDLTVTTGKNVRFVYPNTENPVLNVTLKNNQKTRIVYYYLTNDFFIDSTVDLAGGQIYYFRKKFDILSGNFTWPLPDPNDVLGLKENGLRMNLRASLRDTDNNGNAADLYIDLNNATLNNIEPVFSSSVPMTKAEIQTRIGQSVFEFDKDRTNIQYIAALSTMALDFASNFGLLKNANVLSFSENIGSGIGIDTFSLKTRLLYNFIAEASSSIFNQYAKNQGNAFSRYLDGTILSLGKNINRNLFFNASFELINTAGRISKTHGVDIAYDLYCLLTLAFEWTNPIAQCSFFMQPEDFSVPGFLSGAGIKVQKTFSF